MNLSKSTLKSMSTLAVLAAALAPCAAFASTAHVIPATNAFFGTRMVHFNLRNQTGAAIELRAGDKTMTVEAGKTVEFKLADGTQVINTTKTDKREAGAVICQASSAINDTTVVLN